MHVEKDRKSSLIHRLKTFLLFQLISNGEAAVTAAPAIYFSAAGGEVGTRNMALEDTVNTEAFVSPKNDMFTSSPNGIDQFNTFPSIERDANIIHVISISVEAGRF